MKKPVRRIVILLVALWLVVVGLGAVLFGVLMFCVRAPSDPGLVAARPTRTVVAGPENAWFDYHKLAQDAHRAGLRGLEDPTRSAPASAEESKALAGLEPTFLGLLAATKKKACQQSIRVATVDPYAPVYYYQAEKTLARLAVFRARDLERQGQLQAAVDLDLAVYRLGSDLVEPYTDFPPVLAAGTIRRWAASHMFHLLGNPALDSAQARQIALAVAAGNRSMPDAWTAFTWDRDALARGLEDMVTGSNPNGGSPTLARFAGLRVRMVDAINRRIERQKEILRPALENWDLRGLDKLQDEADSPGVRQGGGSVGDRLTRDLLPALGMTLSRTLGDVYLDRATGAALETMASVVAYQRQHRRFPQKLEQALGAPVEVMKGKTVGYRLASGRPEVTVPNPGFLPDALPAGVHVDPKGDLVFELPSPSGGR